MHFPANKYVVELQEVASISELQVATLRPHDLHTLSLLKVPSGQDVKQRVYDNTYPLAHDKHYPAVGPVHVPHFASHFSQFKVEAFPYNPSGQVVPQVSPDKKFA